MSSPVNVIPGYDQDYYPKLEMPVPALYHKYLTEEELADLYTEEEIQNLFNKAYFVSNPDAFAPNPMDGTKCQYIDKCTSGQRLIPGSKTTNQVIKSMRIRNTGNVDAWVRLFIAIPTILDDAQPTFDASKNVLHFNADSVKGLGEGMWNYGKAMDRAVGNFVGASGWNYYATTINGIAYNVYVATLETPLAPGELSPEAVYQVYLDAECTEDDIIKINKEFRSDKWQMYAVAESIPVLVEEEEEVEAPKTEGEEESEEVTDEVADEDVFAAYARYYEEVGEGKHNPFA